MLLQQIAESLDAELDRLHMLRALVVDLGRTPKLVARLEAEIEPLVRAAQRGPAKLEKIAKLAKIVKIERPAKPERKAAARAVAALAEVPETSAEEAPAAERRKRGRPRKEAAQSDRPTVARRSRYVPEPRALSGTIPQGPVVVLAPALRKVAEAVKAVPETTAGAAPANVADEDANSLVRALSQRWMTA